MTGAVAGILGAVWGISGLALLLLVVLGARFLGAFAWGVWKAFREHRTRSPTEGHDPGDVRSFAAQLDREHEWWEMSLETLEAEPLFERGVALLASESTPIGDVVSLSRDRNGWVASMALAALSLRDDVPEDWVDWASRHPERPSVCEDALLLRALARQATTPVVGAVLRELDSIRHELIAEFVRRRQENGEQLDAATFRRLPLSEMEAIEGFVDEYEDEVGPDFRRAFEQWRATGNLANVGRIWERPFDRPPALLVGRRRELVEMVVSTLQQTPPRSVLLIGEHGVGKTALARAALDRLGRKPTVFETTAARINAGAIYVGELEGRIKTLVESLSGQDVVLVLPELQEALFAGQHTRSPHGLLDALLPHIESGEVAIVAEVTPSAAELLVSARPRVESAFELIRVRPLEEADTIAVGRHALEQDTLDVTADDETLKATFELAQQFLPGIAPPGNLLRLLTAAAAEGAEQGADRIDDGDVLATLAASSGLPLALLDPDAPLPLADVRAFFERRVLEQPEAVDCVVERIAMIKAGVTDPTRPLGVFVFVGPTGTGKTEIAKALAEFLFGSPDRLVRLDMSEYQTPDAFERLLSDTSTDAHGATLISSVRKDPFAVILLDEFEKASQPVWDLFLQVFDDGRLTDRQGRVVDFRRCVIVLTSNLGSPLMRDANVGFEPSTQRFSSVGIERALHASFRPEFLNRIDRVVVFRPFEYAAMRALLDKELAEALARRGLRSRPWAVELDDSAYTFLIDKGFSPALGARPLKRALERYLLAPLAAAIVEKAVPAGDQFLFVTAADPEHVEVTFVDPDSEPELVEAAGGDEAPTLDVRAVARSARSDAAFVQVVLGELDRVTKAIDNVQERKGHALSVMSEPDFWDRADRFEILGDAEYLDRLSAAAKTAERLGARLRRSVRADGRGNAELVALLARRLYVLDRALAGIENEAAKEVFLQLVESGSSDGSGKSFAATLAAMYHGWSSRRGMRMQRLDAPSGQHLFTVSGLGCGEILEAESGLHVLEHVDEEREGSKVVDRDRVRVLVAPRPPGPEVERTSLTRLARQVLDAAESNAIVVRRYRPGRAPLVRDTARGFRTGRLDRVLAGDFDLY
jgi:ATP-dependent Clp protease ATP-binding subunit ClpC